MPDNDYYVYFHRRKSDNSLFYVGKGCNERAYFFIDRSDDWFNFINKDTEDIKVQIICENLTSENALDFEAFLIYKYCKMLKMPLTNVVVPYIGKDTYRHLLRVSQRLYKQNINNYRDEIQDQLNLLHSLLLYDFPGADDFVTFYKYLKD
jgi:hypothetical protein